MSSDGEDLSDGDNSSESNMVWGHEEWVGGPRPDLVCMDSGCNRIILVDLNDLTNYRLEPENSFLATAQAGANLVIVGRGRVGNNAVLHIPVATSNLMSTYSMPNRIGL